MSMKDFANRTMDKLNADVPRVESEYLGEDGFMHCSVCHDRTEYLAEIPELGIKRKVRCICSCIQKERDAEKEKDRQKEIYRERLRCFADTNMISWTFANDDGKNEKITTAMKNYVKNFTEFRKDGKGLLLHGPVGTGKTYLAACIANALIDEGYTVKMTSVSEITNQLFGLKEGKQEFIDSLNKFSMLVIDDLGTERNTEYMLEQVFNIIDARYRSGLPFIITTNLSIDVIKKPQDIEHQRIYDRILERCFPVEISGTSRRRQNTADTYFEVKEKLGL